MSKATSAKIDIGASSRPKKLYRIELAAIDTWTGITQWWMWSSMAWQDIKQRYRGSTLGPFWLTISMAVMIASLGTLYSVLMKMDIHTYLPYLCLGLLFWTTLSTLTNDACSAFLSADGIILQSKIPFTVHAMRSIARNFIILAHNAVVGVIVLALFGVSQSTYSLLSIVGILLIFTNGFSMTLLLGLLCARFRDVSQIVASFMQVLFFVTPILWHPSALGNHQWVATYNPVYALIEVARGPLMGERPTPTVWAIALGITAFGLAFSFLVFARFRGRIAYWL